jgi:hypothetical protein
MGKSAVALALAVLAGVVAIFTVWANQQLLDTGSWQSVSGELLKSKEVRHRVADFLGETLVEETEAQLLAAGEVETAAQVMPRLRRNDVELAERVMATPQFRSIWRTANRSGHAALLRVLDEEEAGGEGGVAVDLTPALRRTADLLGEDGLAAELGLERLGDLVQPGAARIEILEAQELERAQDVVRVVRHLTLPAVLATILFYALAIFFGRWYLAGTFVGVGFALAATGGLALFLRSLAGEKIIDQLLTAHADREAAEAAWQIATSDIHDLAIVSIALGAGVLVATAAWALWRSRAGTDYV